MDKWKLIDDEARSGMPVIVFGMPEYDDRLEVKYLNPVVAVARWSKLDEGFLLVGGDWDGPYIKCTHWMYAPKIPNLEGQ